MKESTAPCHECVLVVDDDEDARESLREAVEMIGCSVVTAASGAEALNLLENRRPCLMVLDLMMPGMSGAQVMEAMRRRPALDAMCVVIATSAPDFAPKGVPVIPKPIDLDTIWAWVRRNCQCDGVADASPGPAAPSSRPLR
ncbi:MAG TPA: response regulator [Polyangiaceae bacterium]|nr:response regulator [Polyangiaceae bacterium]